MTKYCILEKNTGMIRLSIKVFLILFSFQFIGAQSVSSKSSAALYHDLQKLNFLGNVLFIAAHPDDENTRLISYLTHELHANTAYLSLTRGDGGQNLIGTEIRELLGVLRTQELLKARSIDGGSQYFTRANDFGYSKHPDETLRIWNKDEVLSDMVDRIRLFRPDVIINRFDHRTPGSTHGHHTTSAILSVEAFDLASDTKKYPLRSKDAIAWKPTRQFFNTSWWFYGSRERFEAANHTDRISLDVGVYYPLLGVSNNEIASLASSQHLCQGFGRINSRGGEKEYLELIQGTPASKNDLFYGIDTSWNRIEGGKEIGVLLEGVAANFNFKHPETHTEALLAAYKKIKALKDPFWRAQKLDAIVQLIMEINGIWIDANASQPYVSPGETVRVNLEAINRSSQQVFLKAKAVGSVSESKQKSISLENNVKTNTPFSLQLMDNSSYNTPYWLNKKASVGMYTVAETDLIGLPNTPASLQFQLELTINGVPIKLNKEIVYRYALADKGEKVALFAVLPPVSVQFKDKVVLFPNNEPKEVRVVVKSLNGNTKGELQLKLAKGWKSEPTSHSVYLENKGSEKEYSFSIIPPSIESELSIGAEFSTKGKTFTKEVVEINYDHIPKQSVLLPSEFKAVRLNIEKKGNNIGYIMGAGDEVPESLRQIGYRVFPIKVEEIAASKMENLDAVVIGIRAYNVQPDLVNKKEALLEYVKNGGTLITQYNTAGRSGVDIVSPYPLQLSRDRVAEEDAKVSFINQSHPLLNYPNKLSEKDFDGWVQERGLYFPNSWDPQFKAVIEMHDKGESPKEGSLLIAPYGKGNYIYTGLSFFRELPAGVPGAYKVFANMLSASKREIKPENIKQ